MIRHIVLFKLVGDDESGRAGNFETLSSNLNPLIDEVPGVHSLRVAADTTGLPSHWDAVLVTEHETWGSLADYQTHPSHVAAVEAINPLVRERAVADFEVV